MKSGRRIRVNSDVYSQLEKIKKQMEETVYDLSGKRKRISFNKVIGFATKRKIIADDKSLFDFVSLRRGNRRGQVGSVVFFVVVIITLLLMAPIFLKIVTVPLTQFSGSLQNISNQSAQQVSGLASSVNNTADILFSGLFLMNLLILLISSFIVDIHPAFFVVYIILAIVLVSLAPNYKEALTGIYNNAQFSGEVANLPITSFLVNNFEMVLFICLMLTAIIIYAKFKFSGGGDNAY